MNVSKPNCVISAKIEIIRDNDKTKSFIF